jgi:hypothetical protein
MTGQGQQKVDKHNHANEDEKPAPNRHSHGRQSHSGDKPSSRPPDDRYANSDNQKKEKRVYQTVTRAS